MRATYVQRKDGEGFEVNLAMAIALVVVSSKCIAHADAYKGR